MKRKMVRHVKKDPFSASSVIKQEYNLDISTPTIRSVLLRNNLKAKSSRQVPFLSKQHMKRRLKFAKLHINWPMHKWRNILWPQRK